MKIKSIILVIAMMQGVAIAASFDCTKAKSQLEVAICSNPKLSQLDDQLAAAYKSAKDNTQDADKLKATQIDWIKSVRSCNADLACIENSYQQRIASLSGQSIQVATSTANASPSQSSGADTSNATAEISKPLEANKEDAPSATPSSSPSEKKESSFAGIMNYLLPVVGLLILIVLFFIVRKLLKFAKTKATETINLTKETAAKLSEKAKESAEKINEEFNKENGLKDNLKDLSGATMSKTQAFAKSISDEAKKINQIKNDTLNSSAGELSKKDLAINFWGKLTVKQKLLVAGLGAILLTVLLSFTGKSKEEKAQELAEANRQKDMGRYTIVAACSGPAKKFVWTIMSLADNSYGMVSAIQAQSRFCNSMNTRLENETIYRSLRLVANGNNGAAFFIADTNDPNIMVGLIRRPD